MISSEQLECSPAIQPKMPQFKEHCLNKTRMQGILENYEAKKDLQMIGEREFLPDGKRGNMVYLTFKEIVHKVECIARGLQSLGLKKGQSVGIMSRTRPEWTLTDLACSSLGLVTVPIYDSYGPANCQFIVESTHIVCIFAGWESFAFLNQVEKECPFVKHLIVYDANLTDNTQIQQNTSIVYTHKYSQVEQLGLSVVKKKKNEASADDGTTPKLEGVIPADEIPNEWPDPTVKFSDLDSIVHTSGSTGKPKGAMITHTNLIAGGYSLDARRSLDLEKGVYPSFQDVIVSYLPSAHIFQRSIENYCLMEGLQMGYYSGSIPMLTEDLMYIRPTLFPVVPRVLTKIYSGLQKKIAGMSGFSRVLFNSAYWLKEKKLYGGWPDAITSAPASLILKKVSSQFGGRLRICFCGSAPLSPAIGQYLNICMEGARVLEGYGSTECSGASLAMEKDDHQYGSIGNLLCGVEGKLASVPELGYSVYDEPYPRGELLLRGESVFTGYYQDEEATNKAITSDGWLHTGDVACILPGDRFKIIDRIRNVFKLQQGEYIYLEDIEGVFATDPLLPYVALFGDSMMSALVSVVYPDPLQLKTWADKNPPKGYEKYSGTSFTIEPTVPSSSSSSSSSSSPPNSSPPSPSTPSTPPTTPGSASSHTHTQEVFRFLCGCEETKTYLLQHMREVLKKAGRKGYEIPQDVYVTVLEPSVENEQMTPTSKIRRDKIRAVYKEQIDSMSARFKDVVV